MAPPVPTSVPPELSLGTTWVCDLTFEDYPSSEGWTATLRFVPNHPDDEAIDVAGVEDAAAPGTYRFTVVAGETEDMKHGTWSWSVVMKGSGGTHLAARGTVRTLPDPAKAEAEDLKGLEPMSAQETLTLVDRAIQQILAGANQSWTIGIRTFTKLDLAELRKWRSILVSQIRLERTGTPLRDIRFTMSTVPR